MNATGVPKAGFFRVPAILFDRAVYPERFGLSENAFKLYILQCSFVREKTGIHWAGSVAAQRYLGLDENAFAGAEKQLRENHLIYRYYPVRKRGPEGTINQKKKRAIRYWCIANPPIMEIRPDTGELTLATPEAESKSGLSAAFHRGDLPFDFIRVPNEFARAPGPEGKLNRPGPLREMSPNEIDLYFNLLWANRECWFGINPNYVRHNLRLRHGGIIADESVTNCLQPSPTAGDVLHLSPELQERTGKLQAELEDLLNILTKKYELFEWRVWIAQATTYRDHRRSIEVRQVKLRWYVDCDHPDFSFPETMKRIEEIVTNEPRFQPIVQLCSRPKLYKKFEDIVNRNRGERSLMEPKEKEDIQDDPDVRRRDGPLPNNTEPRNVTELRLNGFLSADEVTAEDLLRQEDLL